MLQTAFLSLGSNLGDRAMNLHTALTGLRTYGELVTVSSFYETDPVENTDQPMFINCVAELRTQLAPLELLQAVLSLERSMGRMRNENSVRKGPRIIDIDILLVDGLILDTPELTLPHPAMSQRRFILAPLVEIAPEIQHPMLKQNAKEMLEALHNKEGKVRILSGIGPHGNREKP